MNASWSIDFKKCAIYSTAGGIAGVSIDLLLFPVDSIKTRLQASTIENNFTQKAKEVNKFRGFASTAIASFPWSAVFWVVYETSKLILMK